MNSKWRPRTRLRVSFGPLIENPTNLDKKTVNEMTPPPAEFLVERTGVGEESRGQDGVTDEAHQLLFEGLALNGPAVLLAAEAADQRRRQRHLAPAHRRRLRQPFLLLHGQLVLQFHLQVETGTEFHVSRAVSRASLKIPSEYPLPRETSI